MPPTAPGLTLSLLPSLAERRWRIGLFTVLYLYQGLVGGFATTALVNHFAAAGFAVSEIGRHLAVVGLPWVLQPLLWGLLVDAAAPRRMGARRFWLAVALLGGQACLAGLPLLGAAPGLAAVSAVLFLHSLCASLADTATDRMLTDTVPEHELGRTGACTRAGFVVGGALGAGPLAWWLGETSFAAAATGLLGVTSALALPALLVRERPGDAFLSPRLSPRLCPCLREPGVGPGGRGPGFLARLAGQVALTARTFRDRGAGRLLALCFAVDFAVTLFQVPFATAMVQAHGWSAAALSNLQAVLGLIGGTAGAAAVGVHVDRRGPERALVGLLLACAAAFAATAGLVAAGSEGWAAPVILGLSDVVPALLYVALLPAVILASRARGASATQFQVFMAAMNLGDVAGASAAAPVGRWLSPTATACGVALVFLACAAGRAARARR